MAKILIADDNEQNLVLLKDLLTFHGHEVLAAESGTAAVAAAKERLPDLILLDLQMPAMDGYEAHRLLRANAATRKIKVVAVTSFAMKGDEQKVMRTGFDGYIPKPIDTRQLPKIVEMYLAKKEA